MNFQLEARNLEGFKVVLTGSYPEEYEEVLVDLVAREFRSVHAIPVPANLVGQLSSENLSSGPLSCQFCGGTVDAVKFGSVDQTAEAVAAKRAEKMGKMGHPASPVCGKCWKKKGFVEEWDRGFKSGQWK